MEPDEYILKLEGNVSGNNTISNRRFNSAVNFDPRQIDHIQYELASLNIKNTSQDIETDFQLSLGGKFEYNMNAPVFLKVKTRHAKKGKTGLGFASYKIETLIQKYNEILSTKFAISSLFNIPNVFEITESGRIQITLLPQMGIYVSDSFLFSQVFNFDNTSPDKYNAGTSPRNYEKLPVDEDQIDALNIPTNIKNEIIFVENEFYGMKNSSNKQITLLGNSAIETHQILKISEAAKIKNEFYQDNLGAYLDEIHYIAIDFHNQDEDGKDEVFKVTKHVALNVFGPLYPRLFSQTVLELFHQLIIQIFPTFKIANVKIEPLRKTRNILKILIEDFASSFINFTFWGNIPLLKLLGFNVNNEANMLSGYGEKMLIFPSPLFALMKKENVIFFSNREINNLESICPFPFYVQVNNNVKDQNTFFAKNEIQTIGILNDLTSFTSIPIKLPPADIISINLLDGNGNEMWINISLSINLICKFCEV